VDSDLWKYGLIGKLIMGPKEPEGMKKQPETMATGGAKAAKGLKETMRVLNGATAAAKKK